MNPDDVVRCFTAPDPATPGGTYRFARWGRPIVPIVFGVDDATLAVIKGAVQAVVTLAGHRMAETDPELGANLWLFFLRDWDELADVPDLERLIGATGPLVARLQAEAAHHYRLFRFDGDGAIRACFSFVRIGGALADLPADALALHEAVQMILAWGVAAFADHPPLAQAGGVAVLRPEVAALIRAAYDPVLPAASQDPSHAMRLAARVRG